MAEHRARPARTDRFVVDMDAVVPLMADERFVPATEEEAAAGIGDRIVGPDGRERPALAGRAGMAAIAAIEAERRGGRPRVRP